MKKLLLCLLCTAGSFAQTQIGSTIRGVGLDGLGFSSDLSADGNIIVVGAYSSGKTRVYENVSGSWILRGNISPIAPDDGSAFSVAISSDGTLIATGSPYSALNSPGHVRVFRNIGGFWTQVGATLNGIEPGDYFGVKVDFSSDGSILAVGARYNDSGSNQGYVKIYRNVAGTWTQIGNTILGENENDESGTALSLSQDGNTIAIGAAYNNNKGQVKVFQNINDIWIQIGNTINGEVNGDMLGNSVCLAANGTILAIGTPGNDGNGSDSGRVRVYRNISGIWTQIGNDIFGEAYGDRCGDDVKMSVDGTVLAISSNNYNDGDIFDIGQIRIYQYRSGNWVQAGNGIIGENFIDNFGYGLSLSSNGNILAGGAYESGSFTDNHQGYLKIYNLASILDSDGFVYENFKLYPNPSNGIINISLENNLQLEKVSVYNQLGQLVKTAVTNVINTTELAQGTYYVEVVTNQGKATKKIIVP